MAQQASSEDVGAIATDQQKGGSRTNMWALAVGACGVVVAIVALVIAISANHTTDDNAKIARAVRLAETHQIHGVRADLQRNVAAATVVLKRLQRSSSTAHHTDAILRRDVRAAKTGVTANRSQISANRSRINAADANISRLQTGAGSLAADVKSLTKSVTSQRRAQQALAHRVKRLRSTVASLP